MKVVAKDINFFPKGGDPEFESGYDFCLVTPKGQEFVLTYFNFDDRLTVLHKAENTNEVEYHPKLSVLFYLSKAAELSLFDMRCYVAKIQQ